MKSIIFAILAASSVAFAQSFHHRPGGPEHEHHPEPTFHHITHTYTTSEYTETIKPTHKRHSTTTEELTTTLCTSTITSTRPFGCTITEPATTITDVVNCNGCVLTTTTVDNTRLGVGPVCVSGTSTVTGGTETATATVCLL